MLPEPRTRFSFSDVDASRLKLSEEEAVPPPSPEEQLKEMPKAGNANAHTIMMHINVDLRSLQIIRTPSKSKISYKHTNSY
jgi:hypothetical protein